jgi:hypothetical protein
VKKRVTQKSCETNCVGTTVFESCSHTCLVILRLKSNRKFLPNLSCTGHCCCLSSCASDHAAIAQCLTNRRGEQEEGEGVSQFCSTLPDSVLSLTLSHSLSISLSISLSPYLSFSLSCSTHCITLLPLYFSSCSHP